MFLNSRTTGTVLAGGVAAGSALWWWRGSQEGSELHLGSSGGSSAGGGIGRGLKLLSAHVVFRHGARTPIRPWLPELMQPGEATIDWAKTVPAEEDRDARIPVYIRNVSVDGAEPVPLRWGKSTWNMSSKVPGHPSGELTEVGFRQAVELGHTLRERYMIQHGLVSEVYSPKEVYVRTTSFNRTKQTAQGVLTGMFGAHKPAERVVLSTIPWAKEVIVGNSRICQSYRQLCDWVEVGIRGQSVANERQRVMEALGISAERMHFVYLRDVLVARKAHDLPLPPRITPELLDDIEVGAVLCFDDGVLGKNKIPTLKVSCGVMLHTLLTNLKSDEEDQPTLFLFSAHDSLVSPLLAAVGPRDKTWPPFCADVSFELYQDKDDDKFVKVSSGDKDILVDGCSAIYCPLEEFVSSMERFAVDAEHQRALCHDSAYQKPESAEARKAMTYL
ncbi:lysophosphatidic acid phosphatase type 6-like [Sycon ciliatum]|uniref:lysophosphatidic acid phosphatase type 6-like n=1 Tax=Sycon ciliatum TaxID=27933 RepID=UPI0031F621A9